VLVWRVFWIDGEFVSSSYWAKFLQARSKLLGRGDDGAVVIVYAPYAERAPAAEQRARQVLEDFARAMLPAIKQSLENARGV
jgi:EpsI family protein